MNQDQIKQLNEAVEAVKTRKIENVYFVACGGSKAIFDPAQFIFDRETTLPSFVYNANEFIHRCPKGPAPTPATRWRRPARPSSPATRAR